MNKRMPFKKKKKNNDLNVIAKHHGRNCFLPKVLPEKSRAHGLIKTFSKFGTSTNVKTIIKNTYTGDTQFFHQNFMQEIGLSYYT